jgi:hypothetical protein
LGEGGAEGLLEQLISVKNVSERKNWNSLTHFTATLLHNPEVSNFKISWFPKIIHKI